MIQILLGASMVLAGSTVLSGCASAGNDNSAGDQSPIYGGTEDTNSQAVVALRIQWSLKTDLCTGTLIAPNVVLTARHCVSRQLANEITCDDQGHAVNSPQLGVDAATSAIKVYAGTHANLSQQEKADVIAIYHPDGDAVCNADIALVILDHAIDGIAPLAVRTEGRVKRSEKIRSVGYGQSDNGAQLGTRIARGDIGVLATGAGMSASNTALGPNEFEVGLGSCHDDSGGPAISETTGAVVGVVSRGGDCTSDFGHVYTETSGFKPLFDKVMLAAKASLTPEAASIGGDVVDNSDESPTRTAASGCSMTIAPKANGWSALGSLAPLAFFALRRRSTKR